MGNEHRREQGCLESEHRREQGFRNEPNEPYSIGDKLVWTISIVGLIALTIDALIRGF
jgi:hypothetical protein